LGSFRSATRSRLDRPSGVSGHPDAVNELAYDRREIVNRSRELERDNPIACALLDRYVENVVGCGIRAQARTENPEWNKQADDLWEKWSFDCDAREMDHFYDLQRALVRSWKRDGDVGAIKLASGRLQLVESDQIVSPPGEPQVSPTMVQGVEIGRLGNPTRFHLIDPSNSKFDRWSQTREGAVPTRSVDAEHFIFAADRVRIGQTRGLPVFSQSAWLFEQLDKVVEAVVMNARMAACFGVVIKKPGAFPGLSSITGGNGNSYQSLSLEPAMVKVLEAGEDISTLNPSQPSTNLPEFVAMLARFLGLAFAFPLELVLMDFSKTNYSSARAALLQAQRAFKCEQQRIIFAALRPIWLWKIEEWMADGSLPVVEDWTKHGWITPGWQWVDPQKEITAKIMAMDANIENLEDILAEQGTTLVEQLDKQKRVEDEMKSRELIRSRASGTRELKEDEPEPPAPVAPEVPSKEDSEDKAMALLADALKDI
jgi:lambda family phage portal protein